MTFHEMVKSLRYICDVLKEYVATEERKRAAARKRAEEAARRKAEEAAAREAELKATQERLLAQQAAQQATKPTGRRRPRRGDGPRASTPFETRPPMPAASADVFAATSTEWCISEPPLLRALPPGVKALITQLGRLDAAIRDLFTVTEASRAWFKKISTSRQWGPALQGLMAGLLIVAERISRRMFHRDRFLAWHRKWIDNKERVDRMLDGDWREKVRYILWTNGQRQARQSLMAAA